MKAFFPRLATAISEYLPLRPIRLIKPFRSDGQIFLLPLLVVALFCAFLPKGAFAQNQLPAPISEAPIDVPAARQLLAEATALTDSGKDSMGAIQAERAYQFFRQTPNSLPSDLAEAAYQTGRAMNKQNRLLQAQAILEEAASGWALVYPEGSLQGAKTRLELANTLLRLEKLEASIEQAKSALAILDGLPQQNDTERILALRLIGRGYFGLGQYNTAIPYLEDALKRAILFNGEETKIVAQIMVRLGCCYDYCGLQERAMNTLERALAIQQKTLPPFDKDIGSSYMALAGCQQSLKKYGNALVYLEKALEIQLKAGGPTNSLLAYSYCELGQLCLENKDFEKALAYFQKSSEILVINEATTGQEATFTYKGLGLAYFGLHDYKEAIAWFEQAAVIFRGSDAGDGHKINLDLCYVMLQLGRAQSADGTFEAALKTLEECQDLLKQVLGSESAALYETDAEMANIYKKLYLKTGQDSMLEKSRTYSRLAEKRIEQQIQNETHEDTQKKVLYDALTAYEGAIGTEILFWKKENEGTYLQKAWQLSESMHSYMLFSSTQEANARHFASIPDEELRRDSLLRAEITALEKNRQSLLQFQGQSLTDSAVVAVSIQISAKKKEAQQLLAFFEKRYPDYFSLKYQRQTSSLDKTQALLAPQQTLLEYFVGDSSIFAFIVKPTGSRVVEIKRDFPLDEWVHNLREGISGYHTAERQDFKLYEKTVRQYADYAKKLHDKLIAPLGEWLSPELVIVPNGLLADLPFEALISDTPKDLSNFGTYPFLLRKHDFHYAYSATMLHQMMARKHRQPPAAGLLALAPFYEEHLPVLNKRVAKESATRLGLSALPFSGEEVVRAKNRYGAMSVVLTGADATKQKFLELAAQYRTLHLATHAKANHQAGEFSFLAFFVQDSATENNLLSVGELYNLSLNADLVLLSACETSIGEQLRGEGVVSIATAFAYAGAKSTVASLWSVNDKSTMLVMDIFYREIKAGKPKNAALATAKRAYLEKNPGQASHPFFWAAFVAVGDMAPIEN